MDVAEALGEFLGQGGVGDIALSPDGRTLAIESNSLGTTQLRKVGTHRQLGEIPSGFVTAMRFDPDGVQQRDRLPERFDPQG
ncbi:PD40 domain-containing protein [Embleya scabrispora]|uniref:PD40 domain-containing protein n=1 Tax=Embleya scabrispora TaxID=159449 RepID=UPI0003661B7C|nr:PD40 domain-containing protein [Embleya scabrispora]MYS87719.1 hypothetical protein [Streptomyces sp. SID5474]